VRALRLRQMQVQHYTPRALLMVTLWTQGSTLAAHEANMVQKQDSKLVPRVV
jgi:hypothetical protein